jgi:hypothetical protein
MHPTPDQLKELQDSIYREKVMRARAMTESERFVATLELIDSSFEWMLAGVKMQFPEASDQEANKILGERLDRMRKREDEGLYVPVPPAGA